MPDDIWTLLKPLAFIFAVVLYVLLKRYANRKQAGRRLEDAEFLAQLAVQCKCSEYDLFHACGRDWHLAPSRIERDFKTYLQDQRLPHYVRDFIRKTRDMPDDTHPPPGDPGGNLPSSWSA